MADTAFPNIRVYYSPVATTCQPLLKKLKKARKTRDLAANPIQLNIYDGQFTGKKIGTFAGKQNSMFGFCVPGFVL